MLIAIKTKTKRDMNENIENPLYLHTVMTRVIKFSAVLLFAFTCCWACSVPMQQVEQAIAQTRKTFAPDKRTATFEITARSSGASVVLTGETNLPTAKSALLLKMDSLNVSVIDSIKLLPSADLNGKTHGVVNVSVCNIRSIPKHSGELASQALLGTPLKVLKKEGSWYKIQTPDKYIGWLDEAGFELMDSTNYKFWIQKPKIIYAKEYGFAFQQPSPNSAKMADLVSGVILALEEIESGYSVVSFPDGRVGYIPDTETYSYGKWLSVEQPSVSNILSTAMEYLGRPYLWGGTSGKGMDCSGFTKTVFYMNGMMLPRDASQQVQVGTEIPYDTTWQNLLPGDFLFFGQRATSTQTERINHVAIYFGDGKIIHASGDANITVESLRREDGIFNEYRFNTFVRAKRMLDQVGSNGVVMLKNVEGY